MSKKIVLVTILLMIVFSLTGCLVRDESTTRLSTEEETEIKDKAEKVTTDFFEYNVYTGGEYDYQALHDLFNQDNAGTVLVIKNISGAENSKVLDELYDENDETGELKEQNNIFGLQPDSYELTFEYKTETYSTVDRYTVSYQVKFRVLEKTSDMTDKILTDNGYVYFTLTNKLGGWKIDHLTIDFKELGIFNDESNWTQAQ